MRFRSHHVGRYAFTLLAAVSLLAGSGCVSKRVPKGDVPLSALTATNSVGVETDEILQGLDSAIKESYAGRVLAPGDEIKIEVFREPDFSGDFTIDEQGRIKHPLMGVVQLAGLSLSAAEEFILGLLAQDFLVNPRVVLSLTKTQSSQVIILGEVKNPGVYPLPVGSSITLLQAIALAGGFTELASPDRANIVRKNEDGTTIKIRARVNEILSGRGDKKDITLEPDDVITVPQIVF